MRYASRTQDQLCIIGAFASSNTRQGNGVMDSREYRLGYRADIEGLRAVAILLVVAAHAGVPWLAGGFVGVDVFFVLSGYLITGLLLQEIEGTGQLRFLNFYARRLRRLLPALLLMLVCTCVFAAAVLAPAAQGGQAIAAATASVWLSNIHFALGKLDYFSPGAASNLFLHTWSLGVEEQFYLVWPALMVWALRAGVDKAKRIRRLKIVMFAIGGASLLACTMLTTSAPQMAFYMMPLRAWQFATGALVWLYFNPSTNGAADDKVPRNASKMRRCGGWLGLALIVLVGCWFDANTAYPGWRAWLPTAGAAAVIAAGVSTKLSGVSRLLAWHPLQVIGRISYSWYLWHWPVLLLGGIVIANSDPAWRAGLVALSFLLAMGSYRWVESPIRHQERWIARPGVAVLAALALMVTTNVVCIAWFNVTAAWASNGVQQRYARAHTDGPIIYDMGCDDWFHSANVRACTFGPSEAKHTAVLMGDSIGAQWFPAIATIFNRPDWRLLVLTKSSCPMVDEPLYDARIGREYVECSIWRKAALKLIASMQPDILFLGSTPTRSFNHEQWVNGTTRVLNIVSRSVEHIYILRGTPTLPFDGPDCLAAQSWLPWLRSKRNSCHASAYSMQNKDVYQWLVQASSGFQNVRVLDLNAAVCPASECDAERDGKIVFRDSQHLTATFSESLSGELARQLNQPSSAKEHAETR